MLSRGDGARVEEPRVLFALCAGAVAFFLSLVVTVDAAITCGDDARALIQGFGVAEPIGEEALVARILDNQPPLATRWMTSA